VPEEEKKVQTLLDVKAKVDGEARKLAQDKDYRRNVEEGPMDVVKGHEVLMLYLVVLAVNQVERRLRESIQSLSDGLLLNVQELRRAVFDIQNRTKTIEVAFRANITRDDSARNQLISELVGKIQKMEASVDEKMSASFSSSTRSLKETEDHILEPLRNIVRDLGDSYKITSRTNLMMTEITRKLNDISADLGAMEEALRIEMIETLKEEIGKSATGAQGVPSVQAHETKLNEITQALLDQKAKIDSLLFLVGELSKQPEPKSKKKDKPPEG
jgi:hypothetical protein